MNYPSTHRQNLAVPFRRGVTLLEMTSLMLATSALMLLTVRALHLGTQVNASTIQAATHLRQANSLEERLRGDIRRATQLTATDNQLLLTLPGSQQVLYRLTNAKLIERLIQTSDDSPTPNQRWPLAMNVAMSIELVPTEVGTLVKVRCYPNTSKPHSLNLRDIEVSEVAHDH